MRFLRLVSLAALAFVGACSTAPENPDAPASPGAVEPAFPPVEDDAHLVRVVAPGALKNVPPTQLDHDLYFVDTQRDMALAVILDDAPIALGPLSDMVMLNARRNSEGIRVLHDTEAVLGGLPARRVEFVFDVAGAGTVYFINLHTSTSTHNVQVAVWGAQAVRDVIRSAADAMEGPDFAFTRSVTAFAPTEQETAQVQWDALPLVVDARALDTWQPLPSGQLNGAAFLELTHKEREFWVLAIETKLSDLNGQSFEDVARRMHSQMAVDMQPLPPTNLAVFDEVGSNSDRRWSLTGMFTESQVPVLHRFRLILTDEQVLQLYCWGKATDGVQSACDALYDDISARAGLAAPPPSATE